MSIITTMEDLRRIALQIWGTGDKKHAEQLLDQIKVWGEDPTWPVKVSTPLIRYSWDKAPAHILDVMTSLGTGHDLYKLVNNDILLIRGLEQEFYTVNYAFELALLRMSQQLNFRINIGNSYHTPVATVGRNDFNSTTDAEDKFGGFIFSKHQLADQQTYMMARYRLISEANTILLPMGKPRIPQIPLTI